MNHVTTNHYIERHHLGGNAWIWREIIPMDLLLNVILFVIGLAILIYGSDFFVGSAAFIARRFGVSELIIGLTLVSMGTSLPELGASVYASYRGDGGIAVGNVVGSNIANIALVLGVCIMLRPIIVKREMVKRDGIIMLCVSLFFTVIVLGGVERWEGIVLMVIFAAYILLLYMQNREHMRNEALKRSTRRVKRDQKGLGKESAKLVIGCLGVVIGAKLLVDSAASIASDVGISQTVIGSTLIAFGTSVPELAVSMTAILRRYQGISIGNIIGSNIFNILWVIGVSAMVGKLAVDNMLIYTNIPVMLFVAALLLIFMAMKNRLSRREGAIFTVIYALFIIANYPILWMMWL